MNLRGHRNNRQASELRHHHYTILNFVLGAARAVGRDGHVVSTPYKADQFLEGLTATAAAGSPHRLHAMMRHQSRQQRAVFTGTDQCHQAPVRMAGEEIFPVARQRQNQAVVPQRKDNRRLADRGQMILRILPTQA